MTKIKDQIAALKQDIEQQLGLQLQTPKDFDLLSDCIYNRVGEMVSRNTLRRIWGNMDEDREPRLSTLSILARYLGYSDFFAFTSHTVSSASDDNSSIFLGHRLSVNDGLTRGDRLRITWQKGRVCDVEYNGSMHFLVIHSENTKLKQGDTFLCGLIIEGQPLYLDHLQQGNNPPVAYICGKNGGVKFERLND